MSEFYPRCKILYLENWRGYCKNPRDVIRKPVECGGAIIEHREYITHDSFNVSGFYCEKCGVRYEVLSNDKG